MIHFLVSPYWVREGGGRGKHQSWRPKIPETLRMFTKHGRLQDSCIVYTCMYVYISYVCRGASKFSPKLCIIPMPLASGALVLRAMDGWMYKGNYTSNLCALEK